MNWAACLSVASTQASYLPRDFPWHIYNVCQIWPGIMISQRISTAKLIFAALQTWVSSGGKQEFSTANISDSTCGPSQTIGSTLPFPHVSKEHVEMQAGSHQNSQSKQLPRKPVHVGWRQHKPPAFSQICLCSICNPSQGYAIEHMHHGWYQT